MPASCRIPVRDGSPLVSVHSRPIISSMRTRRGAGDGRGQGRRGAAPQRFTFCRREIRRPPIELLRATTSRSRHGDRLHQSGHLPSDLAATDHEHERDALRPDGRRCLAGVTREAARARPSFGVGTLEAGKFCDLAIWRSIAAELVYRMGFSPLHARVERPMTPVLLRPGSVAARGLAPVYRGGNDGRTWLQGVDPSRRRRRRADRGEGRARLRHQHRLWQAGKRQDRDGRSRGVTAASCCRIPPVWAKRRQFRSFG